MVEEHAPRPIRVVLAAPFPEIVALHEKVAEYADRLDVCGAVMDADGAIDQARVLRPDVLVVSSHLTGVDDLAARLGRDDPVPPVVGVRDHGGPGVPGARATVDADASGSELHDVIERVMAGTLDEGAAVTAHEEPVGHDAPDDAAAHDMPTWFWQSPREPSPPAPPSTPTPPLPAVSPAFSVVGTDPPITVPAGDADVIPPREERPTWPPPWFKLAAEEEARREAEARAAEEQAAQAARAEAERAEAERIEAARLEAERAEAERVEGARLDAERAEAARAAAAASDEPEVAAPPEPDAPAGPGWATRGTPHPDELPPPPGHLESADVPQAPEPAVFGLDADAAGAHEDPGSTPPGASDTAPAGSAAVAPAEAPAAEVPAAILAPERPDTAPDTAAAARTPLPRRTAGRAEAVLCFSGKGGAGTSVVATNLAVALARRGSSVAIVDLNLQYGDVAVMLHLEGHPLTIEALAHQGDQLDADALDEVLAAGPEGVRALLAPASPEFADLVSAASLRAVFRELGRAFDYVIIDSASHLEELVLEVMESADRILIITAYSIASVKDTKVTLKLLQSLGIEQERISVVLNQTRQKVSFPRADIEKSLNFAALVQVPFDARVDDTIDIGAPMTMTQPKSDLSKAIAAIADSLTPPAGAARADAGRKRFGFRR